MLFITKCNITQNSHTNTIFTVKSAVECLENFKSIRSVRKKIMSPYSFFSKRSKNFARVKYEVLEWSGRRANYVVFVSAYSRYFKNTQMERK